MAIPQDLDIQIQALLKDLSQKDRMAVQEALSLKYRSAAPKALRSREEALLYLITRLPATYHGGAKVLEILKEVYPHSSEIKDILDLGAGVGASRWLFSECLPNVQTCALMEQNPFMLEIGKILSHPLGHFEPHSYVTQTFTPHDMAFLSYSLSELSLPQQTEILQRLWPQTRHLLVLIEPGTPQGFQTIHRARTSLIQEGAYILAPCGHAAPCPMKDNNWCHFSVRLPRSMDHQRAKNASLSFEDEKFSYLIASKNPPTQALPPRIIQKPIKAKGHVILDICTPEGLARKTLTKSKTPDYKIKSRLEWGDSVGRAWEQ